jgi:hypothetical protein
MKDYCKNCKHKYMRKLLNGHNYSWCELFDKSTAKAEQDIQLMIYVWIETLKNEGKVWYQS